MDLTLGTLILIFGALTVILKGIQWSRHRKTFKAPVTVMAVLGSGGHTREIIAIMKSLSGVFSPRIYVYTKNDQLSRFKAEQMESERKKEDFVFKEIYRSREVGQSYITSVFTTAYSMIGSFYTVLSTGPDVIICTGPGVCVPIIYSAVILKIFGILNTRIIFVESICRVSSLSLTGRLVFPVVNDFIVQWEEMEKRFKGSRYIGRIC